MLIPLMGKLACFLELAKRESTVLNQWNCPKGTKGKMRRPSFQKTSYLLYKMERDKGMPKIAINFFFQSVSQSLCHSSMRNTVADRWIGPPESSSRFPSKFQNVSLGPLF